MTHRSKLENLRCNQMRSKGLSPAVSERKSTSTQVVSNVVPIRSSLRFALLFFFTLIFASLELARYVYLRQAVDQIAYEACRAGVITGAKSSDVTTKANLAESAHGIIGSTIVVTPSTITNRTTRGDGRNYLQLRCKHVGAALACQRARS